MGEEKRAKGGKQKNLEENSIHLLLLPVAFHRLLVYPVIAKHGRCVISRSHPGLVVSLTVVKRGPPHSGIHGEAPYGCIQLT